MAAHRGAMLIALAALLAGCGGGSSPSTDPAHECGCPPIASPSAPAAFVGNWAQVAGSGPVGTTLDITSAGQITGTLTPDPSSTSAQTEISASVTGRSYANSSGTSITVEVYENPNGLQPGAGGSLSIDGSGHLVGTLTEQGPSNTTPGQLTPLGTIQVDMEIAQAPGSRTP